MITTRILATSLILVALTGCGPESDRDVVDTAERPDNSELGGLLGLEEAVDGWDGEWDTNQDGRLDRAEYEASLVSDPAARGLTREQFDRSAFQLWDENNDGALSRAEWEHGAQSWFRELGLWEDWDTDGNGSVSAVEFNHEVSERNVYNTWDLNRNTELEPVELAPWWFDTMDRNRDTYVDRNEWRGWND